MKPLGQRIQESPWLGWVLFFASALFIVLIGLITYSIIERRTEAQFAFTQPRDIDPLEPRPEVWGQTFPRQFGTYAQMADTTFRSKYYGSTRIDLLERNPRMAICSQAMASPRTTIRRAGTSTLFTMFGRPCEPEHPSGMTLVLNRPRAGRARARTYRA